VFDFSVKHFGFARSAFPDTTGIRDFDSGSQQDFKQRHRFGDSQLTSAFGKFDPERFWIVDGSGCKPFVMDTCVRVSDGKRGIIELADETFGSAKVDVGSDRHFPQPIGCQFVAGVREIKAAPVTVLFTDCVKESAMGFRARSVMKFKAAAVLLQVSHH
jgi:hypothetical protein